jgi:aldose 1-epimerase
VRVITLRSAGASCIVDEDAGARIASLAIDSHEMLVTSATDGLGWGCYPMVPYAGRVRHGRLMFDGREHLLPLRLPPHAIHGSVFEKPWTIEESDATRCRLATELQPNWPFGGRVEHSIELFDDHLTMRLAVTAEETMPVQVGWHPWFVKPTSRQLEFRTIHPRDDDGIASLIGEKGDVGPDGTNDDCFADPDGILTLTIEGHVLTLTSSCGFWVVYDQPEHATCVEPQSGPPDGVNSDPFVLGSGRRLTHHFTISWDADRS